MGRGKRFSGKRNHKRSNNNNGGGDTRSDWKDTVKENAKWESYYKQQELIPENEWDTFKTHFQKALPLTFRITGSRKHADEIKTIFIEKHLPALQNIKLEQPEPTTETPVSTTEPITYQPPKNLPWYPNQLGWQIDLPKNVIRKNERFSKTQRFLVIETEVGNISRQEAVSMIPPLMMDIEPHHHVLDMCAAPGSKTAQLVEALHQSTDSNADSAPPTGFVVANDSDYKRSHMLVHQIKRLNSANFIVVNHDAQMFPNVRLGPKEESPILKYDRILCDVPCSGDGTLRKNITVWSKWGPGDALGLHPLQLNILNRGLQLLKEGGRLVYSTCSLSPIENEAIVAAALRQWGDKIKLADCSDRLPDLQRRDGVSSWKVFNKNMEIVEQYQEDGPIPRSCFPPTEEEAKNFNLSRCMRVYPHLQNTGGFFITVFEKIGGANNTTTTETNKKRKDVVEVDEEANKKSKLDEDTGVVKKATRLPRDANEEPFFFLQPDHKELTKCWNFYDFKETFPKDSTLVRNSTGEPIRTIYYVSPGIKSLIANNETKIKIVHTGTKLFVTQRTDMGVETCQWRAQNESVQLIKQYLTSKRIFNCNLKALKILLQEAFPNIDKLLKQDPNDEFFNELKQTEEGCAFINVTRGEHEEDLFLPLWRGRSNVNLMVSKQETNELLYRIYGVETDKNDTTKPTTTSTTATTPDETTTASATTTTTTTEAIAEN